MSAGDHLSPEQFFASQQHGMKDLNPHHEALGLDTYMGGLSMHPYNMQRTGERAEIKPGKVLVPNQAAVTQTGVEKYLGGKANQGAPISLYRDPEFGSEHIIEGHHRVVAARLEGRSVQAEYWEHKK